MNITISFDIDGYTEKEEIITWFNAAMAGEPFKVKRTRKPRKPMTDEEKAAFRERMVKGKEEKEKVRKEEDTKSSESTTAKVTASIAKLAGRTKASTKKG